MSSEYHENDQLARELLARTRLIEIARGGTPGTWRMLWCTRIRPLFVAIGFAVLAFALMESVGDMNWFVLGGMFCLLAGLEFRPETDQRLNALVDVLERNGTLELGSARER